MLSPIFPQKTLCVLKRAFRNGGEVMTLATDLLAISYCHAF